MTNHKDNFCKALRETLDDENKAPNDYRKLLNLSYLAGDFNLGDVINKIISDEEWHAEMVGKMVDRYCGMREGT